MSKANWHRIDFSFECEIKIGTTPKEIIYYLLNLYVHAWSCVRVCAHVVVFVVSKYVCGVQVVLFCSWLTVDILFETRLDI